MVSHALITVFTFFLYLHLAFSQLPSNQVSTMISVYQIIQNHTGSSFVWNNVENVSNPCSWRGVTCNSDNSSISQLSFRSFQLSTSDFLPIICQIDTLQYLDVSNNHLNLIPSEFFVNCGELNLLRLLNFSGSNLYGPLPSFDGFGQLEVLDFCDNSLSGSIGSQFEVLDSLRSLNLSRNMFNGIIPTNLGRTGILEELQLSSNAFTSEIPLGIIMGYRNLSFVDLSFNTLSGSIHEEFGQLTRLQVLVLSANYFEGGIPSSLSNVTTLFRFAANQNRLNGTIPNEIALYLRSLDLSYNSLTGTIPSNFLSRPNLQSLDLSYNALEGRIPENISTSLIRLRLRSNLLDGMIPTVSFGNLVFLTYLELDNNRLSGPIPSELGMCTNLALLNLAQNRLTGPLPSTFGDLTNLQVLNLQLNDLTGEIPEVITQLNMLQRLNLSSNSFHGAIPYSISRLRLLTNLDFVGNNFIGEIPNSISRLDQLRELQLGNNQLGGIIPEMPPNLQLALNLGHNRFEGVIPDSLSRLTSLEVLDLSDNSFSGRIPSFLRGMESLTRVDLSNNLLSGLCPIFGSHVAVSMEGNMDLRCSITFRTTTRRSLPSGFITAFVLGDGVGLLIALLIYLKLFKW